MPCVPQRPTCNVFIDEVSMIACHELYSISARLAQITGMHDVPFGGMNIILAGDFAQLSPVMGSPLYDGNVERYMNSRMSVRSQETAIGKVLWHQITTVVRKAEDCPRKHAIHSLHSGRYCLSSHFDRRKKCDVSLSE